MSQTNAIVVHNLTKTFSVREKTVGIRGAMRSLFRPREKIIQAVAGVSFEVAAGEMLAFIGPNGAGKSTTIKMLTGILYPNGGEARVLGRVPWEDRQRLSYAIGSVFGQKSQLWYHLPPIDSYGLLAKIYELSPGDYRSRLAQLVETFELGELMHTPVRKMSLGQRMRCEIAGSLLHQPRVLFLDEPTIGLDVVAKQRIRELIQRLNREENLTVFLTSHDAGDIEQLCRRVIIINHGHLVLDTEVSTLKRDYLREKVLDILTKSPVTEQIVSTLPGVQVLKCNGCGLKVNINTETTDLAETVATIMRLVHPEDITISDPPLEEIIATIYQTGPKGGGVLCGASMSKPLA